MSGQVFSIGQLVEAAERDAQRQRTEPTQVKTAAASPAQDIDLLDTDTVVALAKVGRDLAVRMKLAEDSAGGMEGSSGVNTGGVGEGMKDSLTPSAEHPDQFYVQPKGEPDVSPAKNPMSIPTSTDAKPGEGTMTPGPSKPGEFLAPKLGQDFWSQVAGMGGQYGTGAQVGTGGGEGTLPEKKKSATPNASQRTDVAPEPGIQVTSSGFDPVRAVHERYSRAAAALAKQAQSPGSIPDQVATKTDPLVGPGKPESSSTSGSTNPDGMPPSTFDGVRDISRQETHTDAVAEAAKATDLPAAAAKDSTEGVLNEVLKAASSDQVKAAAFRAWYDTLPPDSKIACAIRNKLAAIGKGNPPPKPAGVKPALGKKAQGFLGGAGSVGLGGGDRPATVMETTTPSEGTVETIRKAKDDEAARARQDATTAGQ